MHSILETRHDILFEMLKSPISRHSTTSRYDKLLADLESEMGKKDLTDMLGGGGGRTRQKYRCKADGCQVTPMGVNLAKHYKVNTDWVLLKELIESLCGGCS